MNLRNTFVWNALIGVSTIIILITIYNYYGLYSKNKVYWDKYNLEKEKLGADKALEDIITDMENNFARRADFKFKMKEDNPTDLSRVINIPGMESSYGRGSRGIRVAGIRTINNKQEALIQYRDVFRWLAEGDTIGGGIITSIKNTKLLFKKDGEIHPYDLSRKK